jgi:hypothetical protein
MGVEICSSASGPGSHHCTIDNCEIYSCGWNLVLLGGYTDQPSGPVGAVSTYISVTNCKIHDGINHGLIDLCGDMEHVDIINNSLWNGVHGSFYTHQTVSGSKYLNVCNNSISDGAEGFHFDGKADDSSFIGNTIENVDDYHVYSSTQMDNLKFKNNTYIGPVDHAVHVIGSNYIFEGESGIEKYNIRDGGGIIRNPVNNPIIVEVMNANVVVEFTDGRIFSVDGSDEYYTTYTFSSGSHIVEVIGEDTTPPTASNGQPTGTISDNTPTLSVTSNEPATCKGSIDIDKTYENMDFTFTGTGTSHSYDVINPLSDGNHTVYVRCQDTAGNTATSCYSWSFTIETPVPDTTPPAKVTDLSTGNPTSRSISLTWTAPGDDGNEGTATEYDIRYSTSEIIEANWNSATQCTGEPSPQVAGSTETFIVTGLSPSTTYYFALKTADEVPNWSGISNSSSGTTIGASNLVYVATDGTGDYNCDGTDDHIEINQATTYINSIGGGTVHFKAGTYTINDVVNLYSNMIFEGDGEENTIIELDASNSGTDWYLFDVNNLYDVTLQNFAVDGNKIPWVTHKGVDAFHIYDSNNINFNHVTIRNLHTDGLEFYGSSDCSATHCTVVHSGHDGIMNWFCDLMTYTDNYFEDLGNVGIRIANTKNSRVERNTCICNDYGLTLQGTNSEYPTENNIFRNNFINNKVYSGDNAVGAKSAGSGIIRDIIFENNIIAHGGGHVDKQGFWIRTDDSGVIEDFYIINNVIRDCKDYGGIYAEDKPNINNIIAKNNIIVDSTYGIYGKVISSYNNIYNCGTNYGGGASEGTGDIHVDPLFADPTNNDFHLKSTAGRWTESGWVTDVVDSLCIDAGNPSDDYSNEPTPNGGRINRGAYGNTAGASRSAPTGPDTTPPAKVTDLATSNPTSGSITLTWTAPGDDGNESTAW